MVGIYIVCLIFLLFVIGNISILIDILNSNRPAKPRWLVSDKEYPEKF
jgi:hypothetical protein